jgi:hypothetical protein
MSATSKQGFTDRSFKPGEPWNGADGPVLTLLEIHCRMLHSAGSLEALIMASCPYSESVGNWQLHIAILVELTGSVHIQSDSNAQILQARHCTVALHGVILGILQSPNALFVEAFGTESPPAESH